MSAYNLFLALTVATIVSQLTHTWFVFDSFSRLNGWLKKVQSIIFCSILSVAIFAFVIIERPYLALFGAIIEVIINVYYYAMDFFENGIKKGSRTVNEAEAKRARNLAIVTFWRKNWIGIFFGLLLPMLIYVFALEMMHLR